MLNPHIKCYQIFVQHKTKVEAKALFKKKKGNNERKKVKEH